MLSFFIDLIFPKFCIGCHKFDTHICHRCFTKINFSPLTLQPKLEKCHLEKIVVMAEYQGVVKKLITSLKYQSVKDIGQTLARMIYHTTDFPSAELITAVPLHKKRLQERGFNQAEVIAKELALLSNTFYQPLLKRVRHSQPQAQIIDKEKRLTHLQQTFSTNLNLPKAKSVLIIDDVTTTGTTLNECAKVLKQTGFKKIYGLVVAHGN